MATSRINYKNWAVDASGNVVGNARVEIQYLYSGELVPAASIYTVETGSGVKDSNPFVAESDGSFSVWLAPGAYTFTLGTGAAQTSVSVYLTPADVEFTTRALLVTAIAAGASWPDGTILSAQGVRWEWSTGATVISDMPGALPAGQISLRHFTSAAADGTTSIAAALQAAINYAGRTSTGSISVPGDNNSVYIPPGLWLWTDHDADGVINTINHPITLWSDGPLTGVLVTNNVDDVGFLVQAENNVTLGSNVSNVNFTGLTLWNTTVPTNPNAGRSPQFTATNAGIVYDRSMGQVNNCAIYNFGGGIDCLAVPEGVRIINSNITTTDTGEDVSAVAGTAHIRIKVRQVDASSTGTKYQWTTASGGDDEYYAYSNSVFIDNLNLRAGATVAIDQQEATILIEGGDGFYITNSHIAWGDLACLLVQPRHPQTPLTNLQVSNCLIDPLPTKSTHGVLARDFYSNGSTPASDFIFSNCLVAGCTAEGVWIDLDVSGFQWRGGALKGVGTVGGAGIRLSGGASGCIIKDVSFRNVGATNADPCVWVESATRVAIEGLNGDGNTFSLVKVEIGSNDVVIGPCVSGAIIDDEPAFKIPGGTFQAYVSGVSQTNASGTIASASLITLPLGLDAFYVTGTTTINTISGQTMFNGRTFTLVFEDVLTIRNVGNVDVGTGASIITRAGGAYTFTYNATENKIILVGSEPGLVSYPTRALLAASVAAGASWADGTLVSDGTVTYKASAGATDIPDLPGLLPYGDVYPGHFGAKGDGTTDDTAALQAAIDTGFDLIFPSGNYRAVGLVLDNNQQRLFGVGAVRVTKNGNGVVFSGGGDDVRIEGITVRGDVDGALSAGYTGDNISMTGQRFQFVRGGSMWTPGRPIKATGGATLIVDPIDPIATSDTSGNGYDIELGVSGTATLYHRISNWYAGSFNGGLLLIDTGSHFVNNSLFGKLTIQAGTKPSGVNGGNTVACRIGRDITVEQSSTVITGCTPSSANCNVTFAADTSGCMWIGNTNPASITNNGNANNHIQREVSAGSTSDVKFGDDASTNILKFNAGGSVEFAGDITLPNAKSLRFKDSGGTAQSILGFSSGDDTSLGLNNGANFMNLVSGSGGVYAAVGGASIAQFYSGGLRPQADGSSNLGTASQRWSTVYATNGTINTSDARDKADIRPLDLPEQRVAKRCKELIRAYRWKDAETHGDKINFGVIAQDVIAAFEAEGLNPFEYGVVVRDTWEAKEAITRDGVEIEPARAAGERYGVRYDQLVSLIISAM